MPYFGLKVEVKSFPTVYDNPTLLNIGMSYCKVGKLLKHTFQCSEVRNCIFECLLLASVVEVIGSVPSVYMGMRGCHRGLQKS